jgi:protein-S-isoprenylcysteine O-methyltransferase Ste14
VASGAEKFLRWRVPLHFLAALALLLLAQPQPRLLVVGAVLLAMGLMMRGWAAGHLRRDSLLTVTGPYAHLRHPLYLGSGFILMGFVIAGGNVWLGVFLVSLFVLFYVPTMRREERDRRARAPELYPAYAARVPAFWPRLRPAPGATVRFDFALYRHNREWRAAAGCALLLLSLWAKMVWW